MQVAIVVHRIDPLVISGVIKKNMVMVDAFGDVHGHGVTRSFPNAMRSALETSRMVPRYTSPSFGNRTIRPVLDELQRQENRKPVPFGR